MIVKDEAQCICRCLESVKPIISSWVIVDTGSTDGTQELIRNYMKDIPGTLYERPWVDFAYNRNEALKLAAGKCDYLLFMDADDILEILSNFVMPELNKDSYYFERLTEDIRIFKKLLVINQPIWQWQGAIHEFLIGPEDESFDIFPGIVNIRNVEKKGSRTQDPSTPLKDAKLLESALEKEPNNPHLQFHLAQSYLAAEELELAIEHYEKHVHLQGGDDDRIYWSLFQIGLCQQRLAKPTGTIIASFWRAASFRPQRVEALYCLVELYRKIGNSRAAYEAALRGINTPEPGDMSFVIPWMYEYGLLHSFALAAAEIGEYEHAYDAVNELLAHRKFSPFIKTAIERLSNDLKNQLERS